MKLNVDFLKIIYEGYDPENLEEFKQLSLAQLESALSNLMLHEALFGRKSNDQLIAVEEADLAHDKAEELVDSLQFKKANAKSSGDYDLEAKISDQLIIAKVEERKLRREKSSAIYEQARIKNAIERIKGIKSIVKESVRVQRG